MPDSAAKELTVVNDLGLHARAAGKLVRVARRFEADIRVECEGRSADGKSIVGLLTLAASRGKSLKVTALGADAMAAIDALASLVADGFEEGIGETH